MFTMREWSTLYTLVFQLLQTACNCIYWNQDYASVFQIQVAGRWFYLTVII